MRDTMCAHCGLWTHRLTDGTRLVFCDDGHARRYYDEHRMKYPADLDFRTRRRDAASRVYWRHDELKNTAGGADLSVLDGYYRAVQNSYDSDALWRWMSNEVSVVLGEDADKIFRTKEEGGGINWHRSSALAPADNPRSAAQLEILRIVYEHFWR